VHFVSTFFVVCAQKTFWKRKFDALRIVESKDFPIFAPAVPPEKAERQTY